MVLGIRIILIRSDHDAQVVDPHEQYGLFEPFPPLLQPIVLWSTAMHSLHRPPAAS